MMTLGFEDKTMFEFVYCLINSSFAYWWWRIFDGGITYPIGLLYKIPIFSNMLSDDDKKFFSTMCNKMINKEKEYIKTKLNAGAIQENIKFPVRYRNEINQRLLKVLGFENVNANIFDVIHKNSFFGGVND